MRNRDLHWMKHAELASQLTQCKSGRAVGAVAVRDNRLLATGYNGVPSGFPHPSCCMRRTMQMNSGEQPHLCGCQHAEANCISNAARHGVALKYSWIYTTTFPCSTCMGAIANTGIIRVIYRDYYHDDMSHSIADYANIEVLKLNETLV